MVLTCAQIVKNKKKKWRSKSSTRQLAALTLSWVEHSISFSILVFVVFPSVCLSKHGAGIDRYLKAEHFRLCHLLMVIAVSQRSHR